MSEPNGEDPETHPLLHRTVRDIANGGEGVLTAITHEWHGGRLLRLAHLRPAVGAAWTTAADNIGPALRRTTSADEAPRPGRAS